MHINYFAIRRWLLKNVVPEIVWPKYVSLNSVLIPVRGMNFSFGCKLNLSRGTYEICERKLLGFLNEGMNVIEMGSSLGVLSAIVASKIGPQGRLVSVEASPELVEVQMQWVAASYPNVKIERGYAFPVYLAPENLNVTGFDSEGGSLCGKVEFDYVAPVSPIQGQPELFDVKSLNAQFSHGANVLICDVEGSEAIILKCGFDMPDTLRYVLIELHPWLYASKSVEEEIISNILAAGYSLSGREGDSYLFERKCK